MVPMRCDGFCAAGPDDDTRCDGIAMLAPTMRCDAMPVGDARRCDDFRCMEPRRGGDAMRCRTAPMSDLMPVPCSSAGP